MRSESPADNTPACEERLPVVVRHDERVQNIVERTPEGVTPPLTTVQRGVEAQKQLNLAREMRRKKTQGGSIERAEEIALDLLEKMKPGAEPADAGESTQAEHVQAVTPDGVDGLDVIDEVIEDVPGSAADESFGELFGEPSQLDEPALPESDPQEATPAPEPAPGSAAARMRALLKESGLG